MVLDWPNLTNGCKRRTVGVKERISRPYYSIGHRLQLSRVKMRLCPGKKVGSRSYILGSLGVIYCSKDPEISDSHRQNSDNLDPAQHQ